MVGTREKVKHSALILILSCFLLTSFALTGCTTNRVLDEPPQSYDRFRLENGVTTSFNNTELTNLTNEGQYYTVRGEYNIESIRGFYVNDTINELVYNGTVSRFYDFQYHVSFSADIAPDTICFNVDCGVCNVEKEMCTYVKNKNQLYHISGVLSTNISQGDTVKLVARCTSRDNVQINVSKLNLEVGESFNTLLIKE